MIKYIVKKCLPKSVLKSWILNTYLRKCFNIYSGFLRPLITEHRNFIVKGDVAYLEIPKVASTSLKQPFDDQNEYKKGDLYNMDCLSTTKSFKNVQDKYKFTFVRNPFDRIYSCYMNFFVNMDFHISLLGKGNFIYQNVYYLSKKLKKIEFQKDDSFKCFVMKVSQTLDTLSDVHFRSQYSFIYKRKKCWVDYVGRFETLKEDFEPIRKKYNLGELPHFNKTSNKEDEWKDHYTKELASIVYKRYKKDFDTWYPNAYQELLDYLDNQK